MNFEKIKELFAKNKNIKPLYIILIVGVVLLLLSNTLSCTSDRNEPQNDALPSADELEKRLEAILSEIKGADDVSVMLTYESTGEKKLAADVTSEQSNSESGDTASNGRTQQTSKQTRKLFAPGNEAVIVEESFPKAHGAIVVCRGGADVQVKASIISAVRAVLNIAEHNISVFEKK